MTRYSVDVIQCVLCAARDGNEWAKVAKANGANTRTAWGWVAAARASGDWTAQSQRTGGFRYRKITEEHVEHLTQALSLNSNLTLREMAALLYDRFGVRVSVETVRRALVGACYTLKKTHKDNDYRNTPPNKEKRR
ncbi:hypothetical protein PybrP1_005499, partial [[Pythium] brassicae (nom. inval.)]